jgi:hypothetical protein
VDTANTHDGVIVNTRSMKTERRHIATCAQDTVDTFTRLLDLSSRSPHSQSLMSQQLRRRRTDTSFDTSTPADISFRLPQQRSASAAPSPKHGDGFAAAVSAPLQALLSTFPRTPWKNGTTLRDDAKSLENTSFVVSPGLPGTPAATVGQLAQADLQALAPMLVFSITFGLMLFTIILSAAYLIWMLISPYSTGVMSGVLMSVVLKNRFESNKALDKLVAERTAIHRAAVRAQLSWWLQGCATLSAAAFMYAYVLDQGAEFIGLKKYPVVRRYRATRVAVLVAAAVLFAQQLHGLDVLATAALVLLLFIVTAVWVTPDLAMPKMMRLSTLLLAFLVSVVLLGRGMADEVRQAKHDGEAIVEYVRSLGVQVPQAVIDRAPVLISNYLLSENTTQRLLDLADALPNRRSGENATLWNKVKDTWRLAISGNMTLHELLPSNSTEALGAVGQSIAAEAKGIGVALLNFLLGVLNFFLSAFFELSLFYWTLKFLGRQHRTVMHVIAHRVLGWVVPAEEATKVADKTEKQLLDIFDKLSQSYVHLIMFNFCATFFTFSVCNIEYPITSALISVFLAVLPLGVTVTAPALMLAVPRLIYLKHYECLASFAGITVLLQVYRGMIRFFEVTSDEEGIGHTSVLTLSVVLGYVSFGVKGVVIGPIILLTCRQLWRACNAPRAFMMSKKERPPADTPTKTGRSGKKRL